jgi:NADPH2:quinone reductase
VHAIVATAPGGPEFLSPVDAPDPTPGPGQVVVEVAAAGVNFIDTYRRSEPYPMPYPHTGGTEGAGRVVALGDGVVEPAVGDRVAWVTGASCTTHAVVRAVDAVPVHASRLTVRIGARFRLDEAADAHRALEGRATTGKVLLRP